jgi:hypothetical protein
MDAKRATVHSGKYFLITTLFALIAVGFVAAGAYVSQPALETETPSALLSELIPGLALAVAGILVYRFGKAWALYKTLTAAHEEALADTFDTQRVKSDIVSVVDDRLSDMQTELQSANRELRKLREDEPYDFSGPSSSRDTAAGPAGDDVSSTDATSVDDDFESAADDEFSESAADDDFEPASPDADATEDR